MRPISFLLILAACVLAQEPAKPLMNFGAIGASYNHGASPAIAGNAAYARRLAEGTYSYTLLDALPTTESPTTVTTQTSTGILQRVIRIRNLDVYVPAAAGPSWNGANVGWAWTTGGVIAIPVRGWYIYPNARVIKSSIGNSYQVVIGVMFGGGW